MKRTEVWSVCVGTVLAAWLLKAWVSFVNSAAR